MKALWYQQDETRGATRQPPALSFKEGKGHLSVNPIYGCSLGCPYCINQADGVGAGRCTLASIPELLDALERNASLVRRLRLSVLDFCDPFDPTVAPVLSELLEGIAARFPQQVVLLTTRLHPDLARLDWLAMLPLRTSVFVSLGDATGRVPALTSVERRLDLLADCRVRGLHAVALLRPLAREWTDPKALRRLLASAVADEVVVSGLVRSPEIDAGLKARGWPIPAVSGGDLEPSLQREVLELAGELQPGVPVSAHRSCAINRRWGLPCLVLRSPAIAEWSADSAEVGDVPPPVPFACCGRDVRMEASDEPPSPRLARCFGDVELDAAGKPRRGYCQLKVAA